MKHSIFIMFFALHIIACAKDKSSGSCEPMPSDVAQIAVGTNIEKHPLDIYSFDEPDRIEDDGITCTEFYSFSGSVNGSCQIYEIAVDCQAKTVQDISTRSF